ncbi:MAG: histone family protein [Candidatus Aenigmatarchaeota archaeon]|nr:histone family protein [Candidatus Aenigmarchaeota archaeon]
MANFLPRGPFERILKKVGAKRVSQDALKEFATIMEEKLINVAKEAVTLSKHAGRKTLIGEDIRLSRNKQ